MSTAYVAFGSNLGNRRRTVERAIAALDGVPGVSVSAVSRLYETDPVGGPGRQRAYLNGVVKLDAAGTPAVMLRHLRRIERAFGRRRGVRWGPRTLDLDLLAFDRRRIRTGTLVIPHPRYHERRFVLRPFCDVAPGFVHPGLKVENRALLRGLTSRERVTMIGTWKNSRFQTSARGRKTARRSSR